MKQKRAVVQEIEGDWSNRMIVGFLVRNQNRYAVPGITSMPVGQQISSRRHVRQVQLNVEPNVAVLDSRISLTCF